MAGIVVRGLRKAFGATNQRVQAVSGVDLEVSDGEIVALLGPSGCGKTTTLRCVAGLESPDAGEIYLSDRLVFSSEKRVNVPTEKRGLGMVFQSYALWPHMTIFDNVAYPLGSLHLGKVETSSRVSRALELVQCGHLAQRYPGQLSGGQQQRIALARALVANPTVLLFDEPLSNLDAKLREQMRFEIVAIQQQIGFSAIYVTHDQFEAMTVAQRIVVMDSGYMLQIGNANDIYDRPKTRQVADFVGALNHIPGKTVARRGQDIEVECSFGVTRVRDAAVEITIGSSVDLCVRPELIGLGNGVQGEENVFQAKVEQVAFLGQYTAYVVALGKTTLRVYDNQRGDIRTGSTLPVHLPAARCFVFRTEHDD